MRRRLLLAAFLAIALLTVGPDAVAQDDGVRAPVAESPPARQRWSRMSRAEKMRLRERHERWKALSEGDRERLRENFERWGKMDPAQRQRLEQRWRQLQKMPGDQRDALSKRMALIRRLPPERRRLIYEFLRRIKELPPERLERLKALPRPERKRILQGMLREIIHQGHLRHPRGQNLPASRPGRPGTPPERSSQPARQPSSEIP